MVSGVLVELLTKGNWTGPGSAFSSFFSLWMSSKASFNRRYFQKQHSSRLQKAVAFDYQKHTIDLHN